MAQWKKDTQSYDGQSTRHEVYLQADQYGNIINPGATSVSAFGEPVNITIEPVLQLDGIYGLSSRDFETYAAGTGSVKSTGTLMEANTGTSIGGYGVIRSRRAVRYRPGQGALGRFTAKYTTPPASQHYIQRAGFFTQEQALQIGYANTDFGVVRVNEGKAHIHKLQLTTPGAAETVTITLNNDEHDVILSGAGNIQTDAAEIRASIAANTTTPWIVESSANSIYFLSTSVGPKTGTFSYTAATSAGTLNTCQSGVNNVTNFTKQIDFNVDTLDGLGPSKMIIDPTKLNVYQINFRWLGAGQIKYSVENPSNGDMICFHTEQYSNQYEDVHLDNPSMKLGYVAASLGGTGSNLAVSGASMMGAIEGKINTTRFPTAVGYESTSSLAANEYHHLLTIHNRLIYNDKINSRELLLKNLSGSFTTAGSAPVEVLVFVNYSLLENVRLYNVINDEESSAYYTTTIGTSYSNYGTNIPIYHFNVNSGASEVVNLENLRLVIPPNNNVSMIVRSTGQINRYGVGLTWVED